MTMVTMYTKPATPNTTGPFHTESVTLRSWKDYRFQAAIDWVLLELHLTQAAPSIQIAASFGDLYQGMACLSGTSESSKTLLIKVGPIASYAQLDAMLFSFEQHWPLARCERVMASQLSVDLTPRDALALSAEALADELAMLGANWAWDSCCTIAGQHSLWTPKSGKYRRVRHLQDLHRSLLRGQQIIKGDTDSPMIQHVYLPSHGVDGRGLPNLTGQVRMQLQVNGELGWLKLGQARALDVHDFMDVTTSPAVRQQFWRSSISPGDVFNRRMSAAFRALNQRLWQR